MLKFGTDGVRGVANAELTPELALALGRASARVLGATTFVLGRDTRRSGPMLAAAVVAGLTAEGADVIDLGVVATPVVAHAAHRTGAAGVVISASHNPFPDNGIKLFSAGGTKLSDAVEASLEAELAAIAAAGPTPAAPAAPAVPVGADVGTLTGPADPVAVDLVESYTAHARAVVGDRSLAALRVVLDCAHGAASTIAPRVLAATGADVTVVHAAPDGININTDAGSTAPEVLAAAVADAAADLGLALDGDADRLVAVDADGRVIDGDHLLAVLAIDRHARGALAGDAVVVTVMSNLGFRKAMAERGITVIETAVGDRNVLEALAEHGAVLGGEQSGHLIQTDLATTGDGLTSALAILDVMVRRGASLAELADEAMTALPQVLRNVRLAERDDRLLDALAPAVREAEDRLGDAGRILVRASGTEPLIRVMVEAPTATEAEATAAVLVDAVESLARRGTEGS